MTATTACPTCGDAFERETPEKADAATVSHMSSKTDDQHSGIGYQKAKQLLDVHATAGDGPEAGTTDSGTETSDGGDDDLDDSPDGESMDTDPEPASGTNPTMDGGPPDAEGCPTCGNEDYYDAEAVLRAGEYDPKATRELQQNGRVCVGCNEVYSTDG